MIVLGILVFLALGLLTWAWVTGIDYTENNHSDYMDDDLFGEFSENEKDSIL
jgi:hypothetical protein